MPSTTKPSLDLLRSITDEHVLRALMEHGQLTRAAIAARTGISKPTISDSVRRLSAAGVLVDTGERTSGRGRVGSYYSLAEDTGAALLASISPQGVVAEAVNAFGHVIGRAEAALDSSAGSEGVAQALTEVAGRLAADVLGGLRLAVVSAADPVDRETGRLVQLPDAPFLVGELDPVALLAPVVMGQVLVDNDVNWSARAERAGGCAFGVDDFVYVHLGEGLGCAVVNDGQVRRGHSGLAGEIAHLPTVGPDGAAMLFTEVFAALGLRREASTAVDVQALRAGTARTHLAVARAVCGVLAAVLALADPKLVVLGGSWGRDDAMVTAIAEQFAHSPRHVPVAAARVDAPELAGARVRAVAELRSVIITAPRPVRLDKVD